MKHLRIICSFLICTFFSQSIAFADFESEPAALIAFDNAPTNSVSTSITVEGSQNTRVIEDGKKNKALSVVTAYMSNQVSVPMPGGEKQGTFCMSFDLKHVIAHTSGTIYLKSEADKKIPLFIMCADGRVLTYDGKSVSGISFGQYTKIAVQTDMNRGCYSAYVNGRCVLSDWAQPLLEDAVISNIVFSFDETGAANSAVYIDNISARSGGELIKKLPKETYNPDVYDYTETDEESRLTQIYYNEKFEDPSSFTAYLLANENKAEVTKIGNNGVARIEKLPVNSDMLVQMDMRDGTKNMVMEMDICCDTVPIDGILFYLRDDKSNAASTTITPVTITSEGIIKVSGTEVFKLKKGVWAAIAMIVDFDKHKFDFYVNGKSAASSVSIPSNFGYMSLWRMYFGAAAQNGSYLIDDIQVYGGKGIRNIDDEVLEEKSRYTDSIPTLLTGRTAVQMYSNTAFYANKKNTLNTACQISGDEAYLPEDITEQLFGLDITEKSGVIKVGSKAEYNTQTGEARICGNTVTLREHPYLSNGMVYIPSSLLSDYNISDKYVFDDNHGMLIISDTEMKIDETDQRLSEANRYLFFERKDGESLKQLFTIKHGDGAQSHPRIHAAAEDFEALKNQVKTDEIKKKWHDRIMAEADRLLTAALPEYKIKDGRLLDVSNDFANRARYLAYAWRMTGDDKYGECLWKNIEAVCKFPDWHPDHTLDIAGMANGVALGFDWAYDYFTKDRRDFIAAAAKQRAIVPARMNYYGRANYATTFWAETTTNWGVWINSNILMLASAIAEYDIDYYMDVIYNALRSSEYAWYEFAPNGAWHEGAGYWSEVVQDASFLLSAYKTTFGEDYCGLRFKGTEDLGLFGIYMSDPEGYINNFHDSYETTVAACGMSYMSGAFRNKAMLQQRVNYLDKYDKVIPFSEELLWADTTLLENTSDSVDNAKYYGGVEAVTMMGDVKDGNRAWLSFHGGSTDGPHNHIDEGTFVYVINGVRWFCDLGTDPMSYLSQADNPAIKAGYTSSYFYRRKTEGHNCVVINPDNELEMDMTAFAKVTEPVMSQYGAYATIDLSKHYNKNASKYVRGYRLSDDMRTFTLQDEITLKQNDSELYWFLHTKGNVRIIDNNNAIIYYMGKQMKVTVSTDAAQSELTVMDAAKLPTSPQFEETPNSSVSKLTLHMKASGNVTVSARMTMVGEPASTASYEVIPIARWSAESTSASYSVSNAKLTALKVNGDNIYGFSPDKYNYMYIPNGEGEPILTAESQYRTDIEYYSDYKNRKNAVVKVFDENGMYTSYIVTFETPRRQIVGEYERLQVLGAKASSIPEEYNRPEHTFDNNYNTRWSGNGSEEWLVQDLGTVQRVDAVGVALWMGASRVYKYDIYGSVDDVNYTQLLTNVSSSGTTEDLEINKLKTPADIRYIKYVGYGNSTNLWNNIIELVALKKQ